MNNSENNIHIPYTKGLDPYHEVVADLVCKYATHGSSILDIGCGLGHTLQEINKRDPSFEMFAADIDDYCLVSTEKRVRLKGKYQISRIEELFDLEISFDIIILSHVLEHLYCPLDALGGIMKLLHPHGFAVLAVPNPVRLEVFVGNLFRYHYVNKGHVYAWDRSHWINFLENIGKYKVVCYSQDYFPLRIFGTSKLVRSFEKRLASIFPWLAFSNIAVIMNNNY